MHATMHVVTVLLGYLNLAGPVSGNPRNPDPVLRCYCIKMLLYNDVISSYKLAVQLAKSVLLIMPSDCF